jgi:hypothetical protein
MGEKLTLRMDPRLIERAKEYARSRGKSLSALVADYFAALSNAPSSAAKTAAEQLPPLTRALRGSLRGASIDEEEYRRHLERKYG